MRSKTHFHGMLAQNVAAISTCRVLHFAKVGKTGKFVAALRELLRNLDPTSANDHDDRGRVNYT